MKLLGYRSLTILLVQLLAGGAYAAAGTSPIPATQPQTPLMPRMQPAAPSKLPPLILPSLGSGEPRTKVYFGLHQPDKRPLTLSGAAPFERLVGTRWGWWHPTDFYAGYGLTSVSSPVCAGPCAFQLAPEPYHWTLPQIGDPLVLMTDASLLSAVSTLHTDHVDTSGFRTAGAIMGVAGAIGSSVPIDESDHYDGVCSTSGYCSTDPAANGLLVAGGTGILIGSEIGVAVLISQRDTRRTSGVPLVPEGIATSLERGLAPPPLAMDQPQGAIVTIVF